MKKIIFIAAAAFISIGFSSCTKCQICTKSGSNEVRICKGDYDNNTSYGFAIDTYQALGYNCKASL